MATLLSLGGEREREVIVGAGGNVGEDLGEVVELRDLGDAGEETLLDVAGSFVSIVFALFLGHSVAMGRQGDDAPRGERRMSPIVTSKEVREGLGCE